MLQTVQKVKMQRTQMLWKALSNTEYIGQNGCVVLTTVPLISSWRSRKHQSRINKLHKIMLISDMAHLKI